MSDPIITFDHVVKEFKTRGRGANIARAVDDVSLTIDRGDIFGIIGYSGAGKSTLVRLINALERPTSGTVTVLGTDITSLSETKLRPIRQKIGMYFQQFNLFSTKTVAQNIAYPLQLDHWRKDYQDRRVNELLEFVGLSEHANKYPSQLSGARSSASASPAPWLWTPSSSSVTSRSLRWTFRSRRRSSTCLRTCSRRWG